MLADEKVTVEQAMEFLECSRPKLLELIGLGAIPALQAGKSYVMVRESFVAATNKIALHQASMRSAPVTQGVNGPIKIVTPRLWREKKS